jgi:hypothetical protein
VYIITVVTQDDAHTPDVGTQRTASTFDDAVQIGIELARETARNHGQEPEPDELIGQELEENNDYLGAHEHTPWGVFIGQPD